ncbi:MAG: pyrimidine dimer DNA glycosylase/endonuclease V [Candidatus Thorarchaeota archaeon]
MRLWSIHPQYLDAKGLVALWREALLAQKVLAGETQAYKNHPQLARFKASKDPVAAIGSYLSFVYEEAKNRQYNFDKKKIRAFSKSAAIIPVSEGQILFEFQHLKSKLRVRNPERLLQFEKEPQIIPHPTFVVTAGEKEPWEKTKLFAN